MHFKMCLLVLLAALSFVAGSVSEDDNCQPLNISCACGIGDHKTYVPLELETKSENVNNQVEKCIAVSDPYQACANISCHFTLIGSGGSGPADKDFISHFYPIEMYIPPGGYPEDHRNTREVGACQIPDLKNAAVKCWKWPSWITCEFTCIYGHAVNDGKESVTLQKANCRHTENVWKPKEIQDCKPYLNCKARLVKPGTLKCKEPIDEPAYCEISCLDYEDFDATSLQRYQCSDETFGKSLPHCAVLKGEIQTIRKPQ